MSESIFKAKGFELVGRGGDFYKDTVAEKKGYIRSKQFLCSIISVRANACEAVNASSKTDFIY
jgi:hypothetical protein